MLNAENNTNISIIDIRDFDLYMASRQISQLILQIFVNGYFPGYFIILYT